VVCDFRKRPECDRCAGRPLSTPQKSKIDTVESAWQALAPGSLPCLLLLHPPHLVFKKPKVARMTFLLPLSLLSKIMQLF
jgi:hypothetical protein